MNKKYKYPLASACVINLIFLLLVIFLCDMKYEVSDDFIVDAVLSGAYGDEYDPHLLFSNIILGYFLKFFYEIIPVVSWYFVFQILLSFVSLTTVTYIILKNSEKLTGILLAILFVSFFSDDVYILVQFTKTAALAIGAGGALILHGAFKKNKYSLVQQILGAVLALFGTMTRFSCIYVSAPFLLLMFAKYAADNRTEGKIINKANMQVFIGCVVLVAAAFGLNWLNGFIWEQDEYYAGFRIFDNIRSAITDTAANGYYSVDEQYAALGYNGIDYDTIEAWNFYDVEQYSEEKLEQVAEIKKEARDDATHSIRYLVKTFLLRTINEYVRYTIVWGLILILVVLIICRKENFRWGLADALLCGVMMMVFIIMGREVYRVEYGVFACAGIFLVTAFAAKDPETVNGRKMVMGALAAICICKIPLYIPDNSYQYMTDSEYEQYIYEQLGESGKFKLGKYRCDVSSRRPHGQLIDYMESDTENYYLLDFKSTIQMIYYNYEPWVRLPIGYHKNYSYLGGVTMKYPGELFIWSDMGIDVMNPMKSIVNDNIYLVDNIRHAEKCEYLRKYYYSEADYSHVEKINGFSIWKYHE